MIEPEQRDPAADESDASVAKNLDAEAVQSPDNGVAVNEAAVNGAAVNEAAVNEAVENEAVLNGVADNETAVNNDSVSKDDSNVILSNVSSWSDVITDDDDPHEDLHSSRHIIPKPGMKLELIDETMALNLAEYGKKHRALNRRLHIWAFVFGALVLGFIPGLLNFNIWPLFLTVVGVATVYASLLAQQVSEANNRHHYRTVSKLMNNALWWNQFCSPLSLFSFLTLSRIQSRLLLLQGRYMEMEALLLICRASTENKVEWAGVPKSPFVANDLACTYIAQHRYEEAIVLLKNLVETKKFGPVRPFAIVNLSLCYVKNGQIEEASKLLQDNEKLMKKAAKLLRVRVQLVQALIDIKSDKLEGVDERLEQLLPTSRKLNESNEFFAACYMSLAEVRQKQDRIDEAELHYRTAIDLFKANDNPSYWCLAEAMRAYAALLNSLGKTDEEAKQLQLAARYEAAYFEREMMRLAYIRYRITHEKPVQLLSELVNVDGFPPLSIEVSPPGLEADDDVKDDLADEATHKVESEVRNQDKNRDESVIEVKAEDGSEGQ